MRVLAVIPYEVTLTLTLAPTIFLTPHLIFEVGVATSS